MKQYTMINRVLAGVVGLITLITYTMTLQPSVPFWDCGEFSAATAWQQVPHPPGAPLFLIIARWFHMLPFGDPGWRINMVSAVASAFTTAIVYLVVVQLIERWRRPKEGTPLASSFGTFGAGIIGALAFTYCDTQWFNSVESEVYAAGTTLIAIMIWLMMRWDRQAEQPGHERYLLGIAYLTGLAFGIHLLALLVIPGVGLVIYFRRYKFSWPSALAALAIIGVIFWIFVYKAPLNLIPELFAKSSALGIVLVAALVGVAWWGVREKLPVVYLSSTSMLLIILGFTTYAHIVLRSNAHPPMNENEPDTITELVSYLGREQYGQRRFWPRRQEADEYYTRFFPEYGDWDPPTGYNDDGTLKFDRTYFGGEINYMFRYQIGQMYVRYLMWNFVGRASDIQDAPVAFMSPTDSTQINFIQPTGYPDTFPVQFFALPLLLGLIGFFYHFYRDWKMALVYTALFMLLGVLAALQQNQQIPQPRERDYFYVGSFMIFAMWIGLGVTAIADMLAKRTDDAGEDAVAASGDFKTGAVVGVLALGLLAAPVNMAIGGWKFHNRSANWAPWDYAYNILQSCEKDAILFTNGDNDTFPLWYMQDVAGVRRDIRVVNLSLGQTAWYIKQLKVERPWGAQTVPMSFSLKLLAEAEANPRALTRALQKGGMESIDVPADVMSWATNGTQTQPGRLTWKVESPYGEALGVQQNLVIDILKANQWKRPVYFCTSTQRDVWCGLQPYFRTEGMAYRITPVAQNPSPWTGYANNLDVTQKCLVNAIPGDKFYTEPHYGFKMRNFDNPHNFFMDDHRRLINNYRLMFVGLAYDQLEAGNAQAATAALDRLEQLISPDMVDFPYPLTAEIASLYQRAGAVKQAENYANRTIATLDGNPNSLNYGRSREEVKANMMSVLGKYDEAIKQYELLAQTRPSDPNVRAQMDNLRLEKYLSKKDTAGAVAELRKLIDSYGGDSISPMRDNLMALRERLAELTRQTPALQPAAGGARDTAPKPAAK